MNFKQESWYDEYDDVVIMPETKTTYVDPARQKAKATYVAPKAQSNANQTNSQKVNKTKFALPNLKNLRLDKMPVQGIIIALVLLALVFTQFSKINFGNIFANKNKSSEQRVLEREYQVRVRKVTYLNELVNYLSLSTNASTTCLNKLESEVNSGTANLMTIESCLSLIPEKINKPKDTSTVEGESKFIDYDDFDTEFKKINLIKK
jgi:hypothetical protein